MLSLPIYHLSLFSFNSFMLLSVDSSSVRFQDLASGPCRFSLKTRVCCPQSLGSWRRRSYLPTLCPLWNMHFIAFLSIYFCTLSVGSLLLLTLATGFWIHALHIDSIERQGVRKLIGNSWHKTESDRCISGASTVPALSKLKPWRCDVRPPKSAQAKSNQFRSQLGYDRREDYLDNHTLGGCHVQDWEHSHVRQTCRCRWLVLCRMDVLTTVTIVAQNDIHCGQRYLDCTGMCFWIDRVISPSHVN